uniref:Uncharacterized protein n=1 Tax=Erythrolobus australicus TaxID=1077150 RepID=A0A7S1XIC9_9RHOD
MKRQVREMINSAAQMVELIQNDQRGSMWRHNTAREPSTSGSSASHFGAASTIQGPPPSARALSARRALQLDEHAVEQGNMNDIFEFWAEKDRLLLETVSAACGSAAFERYARNREAHDGASAAADDSSVYDDWNAAELELASSASFAWSDFLHGPVNQEAVQARSHSMEVLYIARKLMEGAKRLLGTILHAESNFEYQSKLLEEERDPRADGASAVVHAESVGKNSAAAKHARRPSVNSADLMQKLSASSASEKEHWKRELADAAVPNDQAADQHQRETENAICGQGSASIPREDVDPSVFGLSQGAIALSEADSAQLARDAAAGAQAVQNAARRQDGRHERAMEDLHGFAKMLDYLEPQSRYATRSLRTESSVAEKDAPGGERSSVGGLHGEIALQWQESNESGISLNDVLMPHAPKLIACRELYEPTVLNPAAQSLLESTVLNRGADAREGSSASRRLQQSISPNAAAVHQRREISIASRDSSNAEAALSASKPLPSNRLVIEDHKINAEGELAGHRQSKLANLLRSLAPAPSASGEHAFAAPGHRRSRSATGRDAAVKMDPAMAELVALLDADTLEHERATARSAAAPARAWPSARRSQGDKPFGRLSRGLRSARRAPVALPNPSKLKP